MSPIWITVVPGISDLTGSQLVIIDNSFGEVIPVLEGPGTN
jgi:hypothetical protein